MGRIQDMRMSRAKSAFKDEMHPSDRSRSFYVDHAGNVVGFNIERADGHVLSYNGETGRFGPFEILPEDQAVNVPPYVYRDGKIVDPDARNTKIEYLYRDADNYKVWNECVIEGVLTAEQKKQILDCRQDGEWFIPHMVGLPEKQFEHWDDQSNHSYFELYDWSFTETKLPPTVAVSAEDLTAAFKRCNEVNWQEDAPARFPALAKRLAAAEAKKKTTEAINKTTHQMGNER